MERSAKARLDAGEDVTVYRELGLSAPGGVAEADLSGKLRRDQGAGLLEDGATDRKVAFDAQAAELRAHESDHPRLIHFGATTCPPCVAEFPQLVGIAREFQAQGLELVSISFDAPEDRAKAGTLTGLIPLTIMKTSAPIL